MSTVPDAPDPCGVGAADVRIERKGGFTAIDNAAVRDEKLSYRARGVLAYLLSHTAAWKFSVARIARAGNEGREAVRSAILELEAAGYLTREPFVSPGGLKRYRYVVSDYRRAVDGFSGDGKSDDGSSGDGLPVDGFLGDIEEEQSREEHVVEDHAVEHFRPTTVSTASAASRKREADSDFDEFWAAYPKKVAKGAARAKWKTAVKAAGGPELILAGLAASVRHWDDEFIDRQFIPHPATWLKAESWNDELQPLGEKGVVTPEPQVIEGEWHEWANGRWQPMGWLEADDEVFA